MAAQSSSSLAWLISESVICIIAAIGGIVVLIGLWLEGYEEKDEYRTVQEMARIKANEKKGRKCVFWGVAIEVMLAFGMTFREGYEARQAANELKQTVSRVTKVEKDTKPRVILPEKKADGSRLLAPFRGTPFIIGTFSGNENKTLGDQLGAVLAGDAGWKSMGEMTGITSYDVDGFEPAGVFIEVNNNDFMAAAKALESFLSGCDIKSQIVLDSHPGIRLGGEGVHIIVAAPK